MRAEIEPYPWESLPRTTTGLVRAGRLGAQLFGTDLGDVRAAVASTLAELGIELGRLELAAVAVHRGATFAPELGGAITSNVRWPGVPSAAALAIDVGLVASVVAATLGADEVEASIDDYDFGLFSFALLRVARVLGESGLPPLVVDVERRPPERVAAQVTGPHPVHEFAFQVTLASTSGWIRLFLPDPLRVALLGRVGWNPIEIARVPPPIAGVGLRLDVGVGRVELSGAELRSVAPGDVVFLSGVALEEFGPAGPARFWIAPSRWLEGKLTHDERWQFTVTNLKPRTLQEQTMDHSGPNSAEETTQLVQEASVSLEAVVGRVSVSLERLARLKPGEVLACDGPVGQPVDLVANGTTVATGELVDIEGTLGVRVLSLAR